MDSILILLIVLEHLFHRCLRLRSNRTYSPFLYVFNKCDISRFDISNFRHIQIKEREFSFSGPRFSVVFVLLNPLLTILGYTFTVRQFYFGNNFVWYLNFYLIFIFVSLCVYHFLFYREREKPNSYISILNHKKVNFIF